MEDGVNPAMIDDDNFLDVMQDSCGHDACFLVWIFGSPRNPTELFAIDVH